MKKLLMVIIAILFFAMPCMAEDQEITDFTELAAAPNALDWVPIVDVSDTTDSAEGTTVKLLISNLFTSPTLVTPALGTPASGTLTSCTGLPMTTGVTGTLPVENGGTEATTFTDGGILIGATAGPIEATAVGAAGEMLVGVAASNPKWLTAGTAGYFLKANGANDPVWTTQPTLTSLEGLTLTNGDIIYASAADTLAVLDNGTATYQLTANGVAAPTWNKPREFSTQAYTASGNITEAQILANKFLTNQGEDADENDLVLPDLEYYVTVIFIVNEAYVIEINPPNADAHEAFDLDGVLLNASDCIDSPITIGAKIAATRMQWDDGTWKWSFDTIRGTWVDTGASD